jgi:branched-chain amino acid transport system ATP-binding protein
VIVQQMAEAIRALKAAGLTVVLSEQNLHFAERVADRAAIIEKGVVRWTGTLEALRAEPAIKAAYLSV